MKCPKCGNSKARYKRSRRNLWKGRSKLSTRQSQKAREDFRAKCDKCKFEFDASEYFDVKPLLLKKETGEERNEI